MSKTTFGNICFYILSDNRSLRQSLLFLIESNLGERFSHHEKPFLFFSGDQKAARMDLYLVDGRCLNKNALNEQLISFERTLPAGDSSTRVILFNAPAKLASGELLSLPIVWGIFFQDDSKSAFLTGLCSIATGRKRLSLPQLQPVFEKPGAMDRMNEDAIWPLSPREYEIMGLVSSGRSNADISAELEISLHTVKTHLYNIYKKIDVPNRFQATLWALAHFSYLTR